MKVAGPLVALRTPVDSAGRPDGIELTVTDTRSVSSVFAAVNPVRPDSSVTVGFEDLGQAALLAGADELVSGPADVAAPTLRSRVDALGAGGMQTAALAHTEILRIFPGQLRSDPPILPLRALARAPGVDIEPRVRCRHDAAVAGVGGRENASCSVPTRERGSAPCAAAPVS